MTPTAPDLAKERLAALLPVSRIARMQTGAKLFLILSTALLPLALIAIIATLQTTRTAGDEMRARLRVAAEESARAIAIELVGDTTALRVAVKALASDPADAPSCARAQGVFAQQAAAGTRFVITDRHGLLVCGDRLAEGSTAMPSAPIAAEIVPDGLIMAVRGDDRGTVARVFYPTAFLQRLSTPSGHGAGHGNTLMLDGGSLVLQAAPATSGWERLATMQVDLGIAGLSLRSSVRSMPITSPMVVALLLPLIMWIAGASVSWFVVDRLLIRPLRSLRSSVAAYSPGEEIDPDITSALPAQEIRELGDTFRAISRTVALHEAGLAEGLVRQTKLTREVHHRVKNNLQVISSLINFHARGAQSADAIGAYSSIQRRVDALAVVHRNHFAEMEENRGLNLRSVLGELAANIRATAPEGSGSLGITLDIDPYFVNQDVAVAVAFLVTETIELAIACDSSAQIRVAVKPAPDAGKALLRVVARALVDGDRLRELASTRYGRVMEGLSRQLRSPLHHDPLTGAYEIAIAVVGRD